MEQSHGERLRGQIEEAYGKLLYTYQTQQEAASLKFDIANRLSIAQIVLTSLSACGVIAVFFGEAAIGVGLSSMLSAVSLAINLYTRGARLAEGAERHARCADRLWAVVQDYISLLTDFEDLDIEEIRARRNGLQAEQVKIYREAPRTNEEAYVRASEKLKGGHQIFELDEINKLMPGHLRE